ncbi:MAG: cellobiose phosphorylase, partial [Clostridia bacterium]|nr:cellobiose phosphorylase [Clostridia bacterium]
MIIETNVVGFVEENNSLGLRIIVKYFTVTDEKYPGLVRKVSIENTDGYNGTIQVADGLMTLWPFGNKNAAIKDMSNLSVAFFEVYNTKNKAPFYRNRSTTSDSAEVGKIEAGHFYAAFSNKGKNLLPVIYDPEILFSNNTALSKPNKLEQYDLDELISREQYSANKIPCAFGAYDGHVGEKLEICSIIGKMNSVDILNSYVNGFNMEYIDELEQRASALGDSLTEPVDGKTAYPKFDAYIRQSFLDNLLRGGYPIVFDGLEGPMTYHVYSRIHGDMEREYNYFVVEPAYYSQGIGAFRDVNQNRRNDVYFVKEAGLFNLKLFMELIQLDGQNPVSIQGSKFKISYSDLNGITQYIIGENKFILDILKDEFTPGQLVKAIDDYGVKMKISRDEFLNRVMAKSMQVVKSAYGHGYWSDHWTYNMDLVDSYLNIYPDKFNELLFKHEFRYFISPATVLPRRDKYVLNKNGDVRQYDAVIEDRERLKKLRINPHETNWHMTDSGDTLRTNLFVKLLSLVLNKMTNMDQSGIGIMMNSDKPGWNDSMNGLPGLFGSGTSETIELKRIVLLLKEAVKSDISIKIPGELYEFYLRYRGTLNKYLKGDLDDLGLFEAAQKSKETFNEIAAYNVSGIYKTIEVSSFGGFLDNVLEKINSAIDKAIEIG